MPTLDAAACADLMDEITKITAHAAETILDFAEKPDVRSKADGSPVTSADLAAEAIICEGLKRLAPDVPIISEEQEAREKQQAFRGGSYFLVDPLDGTREFIAGRDEYTINIALMTDGAPLLGIICAPALGIFWRGVVGPGADRILAADTEAPTPIHTRPRPQKRSRRHGQPLASRSAHQKLCRRFAGGKARTKRLIDKILPAGRRLSRPLSAAGADP